MFKSFDYPNTVARIGDMGACDPSDFGAWGRTATEQEDTRQFSKTLSQKEKKYKKVWSYY